MTIQSLAAWTEVPVRNIDAAVAFYDAALGTTTKVDRTGPRPMAVLDGHMTGGGCTLFEGEPAPGTIIHFHVSSMDEAAARAKSAGGAILGDPVTFPHGRYVYVSDPDGNKLGLFEPKG